MPIFLIAVGIVVITLLLGMLLAQGTAQLDTVVKNTYDSIENRDKGFSPTVTLGHRITVQADLATQLKEARNLAAKKAAALPRGANMKVGRLGQTNLETASQRLDEDPFTAVKVAAYHGWDGARTGAVVAAPVAAAPAPSAAASGKIELVPGKDYPVIEISDDMSPDEKRKARIANAKAKSAAMKAAKEAGQVAPEAVAASAAVATAVAAPKTVPVDVPEPPQLIAITEDMSPDEKRKALISNSKTKSAYNKALKAAGLDPKAVAAGATPAASVEATPAASKATAEEPAGPPTTPSTTAAADIPPPDYIEITDDMSPDDKRKARIQNAKARSTYNKALKAAGIDPKSVQ